MNLPTVITPEFVQKWFDRNFAYGAPTNAADIAPALDAEYKRLLYADHVPVQYGMSLAESLRYYELFPKYLRGKIDGAPEPVFNVYMVYSGFDNIPEIGKTIVGDDAVDFLWNVSKLDDAKETRTADKAIACFACTFKAERDVDSYTVTRLDDFID